MSKYLNTYVSHIYCFYIFSLLFSPSFSFFKATVCYMQCIWSLMFSAFVALIVLFLIFYFRLSQEDTCLVNFFYFDKDGKFHVYDPLVDSPDDTNVNSSQANECLHCCVLSHLDPRPLINDYVFGNEHYPSTDSEMFVNVPSISN